MHRILLVFAAVVAVAQVPGPRTLRLDYVHTGMVAEENFALDGVVLEGAWPGRSIAGRTKAISGSTTSRCWTPATNRVIYSRGYCQHLRRVGDHQRGEAAASRLLRKRPLPRALGPSAGGDQEARRLGYVNEEHSIGSVRPRPFLLCGFS
jgi:hypothetical protein